MPRSSCFVCHTTVRSMAEHLTTAKHRAATTSIRSTGPKGSHAYRAPVVIGSEADHWADLEERALAVLPPSVDELFPDEIMEPVPDPEPAERGYRPEPCGRCGRTFRTDGGRSWHLTRNPKCERWRPARARLAS